MGLQTPHATGRNKRFYVARETTFGTYVPPAATSAVKVMRSQLDGTQERINRRDSSQTGSTTQRITGRRTATWSVDTHLIPSGTAGTPPDVHDLLYNFFGTYNNTPATSDAYTIADSQTARGSISLTEEENSVASKAHPGSWVEQFKVSYTGTSLPMLGFEGGSADHYFTGYTTLTTGLSGGETAVVVDDPDQITIGSVISVGSSNNSGGSPPGHLVTNKVSSTLTVSPAISGAQLSGVTIAPYVPTETTAGSILAHPLCSATLSAPITGGSTTLQVVSFELVSKNNYEIVDDEAGSAIVTDLIPSWRDTTGTITFRARRDQLIRYGHWRSAVATTRALTVTLGTSAGNRMVVSLPYIEVENPKIETPEAESCMITLPFYALGSSGADELAVSFT